MYLLDRKALECQGSGGALLGAFVDSKILARDILTSEPLKIYWIQTVEHTASFQISVTKKLPGGNRRCD
jgi:hypothetical protein